MTGTLQPKVDPSIPAAAEATREGDARSAPSARRSWFGSVTTRVLAAYLALLAGAIGVTLLFIRQALLLRLDREVQTHLVQEHDELRRLTGGIDPRTGDPFGTDVRAMFRVYFSRNVPNEGEAFVAVVDGELWRLARAHDAPFRPEENAELLDRWGSLEESESAEIDTPRGPAVYLAAPILGAGGDTLGVFAVINYPSFERAEVESVVRVSAAVAGVVLLVASLVGWRVAGRTLRPLRQLSDTAHGISETDLTRRIEVDGRDEISRLGRTFNEMLDRLELAFATQRQFVDDAGHELRTPITIIRGHLELLEDDPEDRRRTLALVTDELDRMSRMVNDLLLLAKAQQPDFLDLGIVDVEVLTRDVHAKAVGLAPRDWRLEAIGRGRVVADGQRLTQALVQLAQNAVQHTAAGDVIRVGSSVSGEGAVFWVRDSGPGISPEQARRIFDRFSRVFRGEGAGLGLAIVRAIAEGHRGRVWVDSEPGAGAAFFLAIPIDQPRPPAGEPDGGHDAGRVQR